jgi:hypothetical protein
LVIGVNDPFDFKEFVTSVAKTSTRSALLLVEWKPGSVFGPVADVARPTDEIPRFDTCICAEDPLAQSFAFSLEPSAQGFDGRKEAPMPLTGWTIRCVLCTVRYRLLTVPISGSP